MRDDHRQTYFAFLSSFTQADSKNLAQAMIQPSFCTVALTPSELILFKHLQILAIKSLENQKEHPNLRGTPVEKYSINLIKDIENMSFDINGEGNSIIKTTHDPLHQIVKSIRPAMAVMVSHNREESVFEGQSYDFRAISELYFKITDSLLSSYSFGQWY